MINLVRGRACAHQTKESWKSVGQSFKEIFSREIGKIMAKSRDNDNLAELRSVILIAHRLQLFLLAKSF